MTAAALLHAQYASIPDPWSLPVRNLASSGDLAAGLIVCLDSANQIGSLSPVPGEGTFTNLSLAVCLPPLDSDSIGLGWLSEIARAQGNLATMYVRSVCPCTAAGSVSAGTVVAANSSANRQGWVQTAGSGMWGIGLCLTDASDSNLTWIQLWGSAWLLP